MQLQIQAHDDAMAVQVEAVLQYYLPSLDDGIDRFRITVEPVRDPLDNRLYRCEVTASLSRGDSLSLEEMQADLGLTITRALDRTVRTLRRRQSARGLRRSA